MAVHPKWARGYQLWVYVFVNKHGGKAVLGIVKCTFDRDVFQAFVRL
jgi:hypothetical protein